MTLPSDDPWDIPDFLRLTTDQRRAAWDRNPPRPPPAMVTPRDVETARAAERKRKSYRRIEALKAKREAAPVDHAKVRWDSRRNRWVSR